LEQTAGVGAAVEDVGGWRLVGLDEGLPETRKCRHSTRLREEVADFVVVAAEEEVIETSRYLAARPAICEDLPFLDRRYLCL
jgi:hypothetical protein